MLNRLEPRDMSRGSGGVSVNEGRTMIVGIIIGLVVLLVACRLAAGLIS